MDTAVSGKDRAKALAPFGPVHGLKLVGFRDGFSRAELIMGPGLSKEGDHEYAHRGRCRRCIGGYTGARSRNTLPLITRKISSSGIDLSDRPAFSITCASSFLAKQSH
jgi:hypothetical protein